MAINPILFQDPRTAMRHHNTPEELTDQVIDARIEAGQPVFRHQPSRGGPILLSWKSGCAPPTPHNLSWILTTIGHCCAGQPVCELAGRHV